MTNGKRKRFLSGTILYPIIFILIVGYFLYFEHLTKEEGQKEGRERIFNIDTEGINEIDLRRGEEREIILKKGDDGWNIIYPVKTRADKENVDTILREIERLKRKRVVEKRPLSLETFGLKEPSFVVSFNYRGGANKLLIGDLNPTRDSHYAKKGDENDVFLIERYLKNLFDRDLFTLRDKRLIRMKPDKVDRIEIKTDRLHLTLIKEDGKWQLKGRRGFKIKDTRVDDMIWEIHWLEAKEFVMEKRRDLNGFGLDNPYMELSVSHGKETETVYLGNTVKEKGYIYAMVSWRPEVVLISNEFLKKIPSSISEIEDRTLLTLEEDEVENMRWSAEGGEEARLEKIEKGWNLFSSFKGKRFIGRAKVTNLLRELKDAEYAGLLEGTQEIKDPALILVLQDKDKKIINDITIGHTDDTGMNLTLVNGKGFILTKEEAYKIIESIKAISKTEEIENKRPETGIKISPH